MDQVTISIMADKGLLEMNGIHLDINNRDILVIAKTLLTNNINQNQNQNNTKLPS